MDIIVDGTQGGYRVFYPIGGFSPIGDVRFNTIDERPVGEQAYSIVFTNNECVFSKYTIIRDVNRNISVGYIAFSIVVPNSKKIFGADAKTLLDKVSNHYCSQFAPDNNLDKVPENWTFLEDIKKTFTLINYSAADAENIVHGTVDAAYIYYSIEEDLQKYFDAPYQEEYFQFKQVFFVKSNLKEKHQNPLYALRHSESDLTGRIDLENMKYELLFNTISPSGIRKEVKVNGLTQANKIKIRWKSDLAITWSKQYFKTELQKGKCYEIDPIYIGIDKDKQTISIKDIELNPEEKSITLEIKDHNVNSKTDTEIKIGNVPWEKISQSSKIITFKGEDIGKYWTVSVRKAEFSGKAEFVPEKTFGNVYLVLKERNIVSINVKDEETGEILEDFEVQTKFTNGFEKIKQLEFVEEQIIDNYIITIRKNGYENKYIYDFQPLKRRSIDETLTQKTITNARQIQDYTVNLGEHGRWKNGHEYYSKQKDGSDVIGKIVTAKGYKFSRFELIYNNCLIAQYDKKESFFDYRKLIAILIVGAIALGLVILMLISEENSNYVQQPIDKSQILNYVEGDSLILEKLDSYARNWESQKPAMADNGGSIFSIFRGAHRHTESNEYIKWNQVLQSIINAKNKRKLIESANFGELKKLIYSDNQKKFKTTIEKINDLKYEDVRNQLGDVSALTLNQIAISINSILTSEKAVAEEKSLETKDEKKADLRKENASSKQSGMPKLITGPTERPNSTHTRQQQLSPDKIYEISQYLKGGELKTDQLQTYLDLVGNYSDLKPSIELCMKLWTLNGNHNNSYSWMKTQIEENVSLKYSCITDSELKTFLNSMCKLEHPKYFEELPQHDKDGIKTLTKLKNKLL